MPYFQQGPANRSVFEGNWTAKYYDRGSAFPLIAEKLEIPAKRPVSSH
jgi:hypothetical protein